MKAASILCEFVRQIGKSIQKLLVAARASGVSADRVILLGKRQRADGCENQAEGETKRRREGARKFARNYIYGVRSGTLTHAERSYIDGSRSGGVPRDRSGTTAAVFLFWCTSKNLNASLNVLAPCSMHRRWTETVRSAILLFLPVYWMPRTM